MQKLPIFIFFVLIISCNSKKQQVPYISGFPQEILVNEYVTLPMDLLNPSQVFVSSKYIAVLIRHEEKMIRVYDRQTNEYISSFVSEGRGPNEVLLMNRIGQTHPTNENLLLKIQSFPLFVAWLDIDSSIRENKTIFTDKVEFSGVNNNANYLYAANDVYYLGENNNLLMFMDPERSKNKFENSSPFSVIYNLTHHTVSDTTYWYSNQSPNAPMLLFSSSACMSYDKKYIGRANRYINSIVIEDILASRIHTVYFDENAADLINAEEKKITYWDEASANDEYLYALRNISSETSSEIWIINWNGEPIAKVIIPLKIRSLFVTDLNQVYAITDNDKLIMFECNL